MKTKAILLIDIGSTFTKVVAFDPSSASLLGVAKSPSTVEINVNIGLEKAITELCSKIRPFEIRRSLACSSAAGGLKMAVIGLVPSLTMEAGKRAALGAGAKVVGCYAHKMIQKDLKEIEDEKTDIILLAGGTDGGDEETILANARLLARSNLDIPIVVAGNKVVAEKIEKIFQSKKVRLTENVMPEVNKLNIDPARAQIREIFLQNIISAKGIDKVKEKADVLMPTPLAVLNAVNLLSIGTEDETGLGELVLIDVGGATTDVHSAASGAPTTPGIIMKGLPEPYAKRTVEGDLGIRYNAGNILSFIKEHSLFKEEREEFGATIEQEVKHLTFNANKLPETEKDFLLDTILVQAAVKIAMERHVGSIELFYTTKGTVQILTGKDLRTVKFVVGTGGPVINSPTPENVLKCTRFDTDSLLLGPTNPSFLLDEKYITFAAGLLSEFSKAWALRLLKSELKNLIGDVPMKGSSLFLTDLMKKGKLGGVFRYIE